MPERIRFVIIPRIRAQAIDVMVILPKVRVRPPIPEIRITLTSIACALILGIITNLILSGKKEQ